MRVTDLYKNKKPVISMEFFPPRTEKAQQNFSALIDSLAQGQPDYMSVTFGAGGSTRDGSYQTVRTIMKEKNQPTVAYIAGYGLSPEEIKTVLDRYQEMGVETIFVVRGDMPQGTDFVPHPDSFNYASDMISYIKGNYDFTLGCAGYPEGHIDAKSLDADIECLKLKVDNGAEYVMAQYFYDNDFFYRYVDKCRKAGIDVPIIPGVMPVYTVKMTANLAKVCGTTITPDLEKALDVVDAEDKEAVLALGVTVAAKQCKDLLAHGVDGLHFYTMNRAKSTLAILKQLAGDNLI